MLDSLKEIECAYNLLKTSITGGEKDPIDAHYEALKTKIEPMDKDCDEWKHILKYTKDTHAATHSSYTLDVEEVTPFYYFYKHNTCTCIIILAMSMT